MRNLGVTLLLLCVATLSVANTIEAYRFDDPVRETRYKQLIEELRCLVCQNQNLADSNAELAQDMRRLTYDMVREGRSKQEVADFMVQRYGDFVLYRPPFRSSTAILWIGPFIIFGVGVVALVIAVRRRNREPVAELSQVEHERASSLLEDANREDDS
jgi:cytochrome c-type biogenesis protein CcmH